MKTRFKRWLVFKWLNVVGLEELQCYVADKRMGRELDNFFEKVANNMIDTYFKETK